MDLVGLGAAATAAKDILGMIFPNKTEEEKAQLAASLALVQGQMSINAVEAQSADPLQHWRGGMGWVCVLGYLYNFVVQPLVVNVSDIMGKTVQLHPLDIGPLSVLTMGMLGLTAGHVAERMKGAT